MVRSIKKEVWICPYCKESYSDYNSADICAIVCANVEEPELEHETEYFCVYCESIHFNNNDAVNCEKYHIKEKDKFYEAYIEAYERKKLLKAGNHPTQTKVVQW